VVERRKASAPCRARAASQDAEVGELRRSGVPHPFILLFVPRLIVMAPALHHRDHLQTIRNAARFLRLACS
jgi:hypothetical protein